MSGPPAHEGPPADEGLPAGWTISLDPNARRTDGGRTLLGGAPFRILRLTGAGARWLDRALRGEPVAESSGARRMARRLVDATLAVARPHGTPRHSLADVDVVVPTHDRPDELVGTLRSLPRAARVTVVDDASTDPDAVRRVVADHAMGRTAALAGRGAARAAGGSARRNEQRLGPGGARTVGIGATERAIVAMVDANVVLTSGALESLLAHFDDPALGAVAPRVAPRRDGASPALAAYEDARSPLDLGPSGAEVRPLSRVAYVPTTTLLVRREAFDDVGGFDARLRWGEDVDLVWRLVERGWRVRYDPSVTVTHPVRRTWRAWLRQRVSYGSSAADLHARHGRAVSPLATSGWSALTWGLVLAGFPAAAAIVAAGTTAALVPKLRRLDHPVAEAVRIAGLGHLWVGRNVGHALWRTWWPISLVLAATVRRTRPALGAALVLPALLDWRESHPAVDPVRYLAISALDDAAYGAGVWSGCLRRGRFGALLPSFTGPIESPADPPSGV